nr:hypothetical protein [Escherichia coli]
MARLPKKIDQEINPLDLRQFVSSAAQKTASASAAKRINLTMTDDDLDTEQEEFYSMEQCIFDFGIINYNPAITWTVPAVFFFLALLAGIVFNIGRRNNLIVFVWAMSLPVITVFIFIFLGGKINIC